MNMSDLVDFTKLSDEEQYTIFDKAMRNDKLKWTDVLVATYPQFKDTAFVSNLIQQYKTGSVNRSSTTSKRTREEVSQPKNNKVAAGLTQSSIDLCNRMQAFISLLPPGLVPTNGHTQNEGNDTTIVISMSTRSPVIPRNSRTKPRTY